ncbi:MAG: hypothetical protein ACXACX_02540 [Candidatus Hodarchaeales archaeon]|jgi:hypothetical protein
MNGAEHEVSRILEALGNPYFETYIKPILGKVHLIQSSFQSHPKYSKVEKLVPLVIYTFLTLRGFRIGKSVLIQMSDLLTKEFYWFFHQLKYYILNYWQRGKYGI